ncbi:TIGR03557 family F420-dependent LLM class oxidoreductase, partial [Streptomyces albidoflavus]
MLGAVANATSRVELMTYVTCPTTRYHPAVVAQKAATLQILSEGRFLLGLGSGESLNEHVVGQGWPSVDTRQDKLVEAIEIIRELHTGDLLTYVGEYYRVDSARIWDVPDTPVELGIAVSGPESIESFAPLGEHMVAVEPQADLVTQWEETRREAGADSESRKIGQIPISWDPDEQ